MFLAEYEKHGTLSIEIKKDGFKKVNLESKKVFFYQQKKLMGSRMVLGIFFVDEKVKKR